MTMPTFSKKWHILFLGTFFVLGGCTIGVQPKPATGGGTSSYSSSTASWKGAIADIQKQVKKADSIQSKAISGFENRLALLESEVNELRGSLEMAQHANQQLNNRLSSFETTDMGSTPVTSTPQTQLAVATTAKQQQQPTPVVSSPIPELKTTPAEVTIKDTTPASSRETYDSAYQKLLARHFPESLQEFNQFLTWFPNDNLADNAQYWIGELHYVQKQFPEALQAFNNVLVRWPNSTKVPPCLLKIGFSFYELGDMENARISLTRLVNDYPTSTAVPLAKQRLEKIKERAGEQ
ncbi:MAG: tol-pal system protein YbgF [Magnetococcales bacterium]|nr:tol-pal system protein YbgF [Magnetococcales bacterium]